MEKPYQNVWFWEKTPPLLGNPPQKKLFWQILVFGGVFLFQR